MFTKDMMEDHQHQMNWERGQVDYTGVDAFEHIQRRIDTVISQTEVAPVSAAAPGPEVAQRPAEPRPPPSDLDQTEREEMFVRGSPRKREAISNEQVNECKLSPSKKSPPGFRPRPKPMRGRGQQDHRERYVRVATTRNRQPVTSADLEAISSTIPSDS